MTHEYVLMTRSEDAKLQNLPTIQFVDLDCPDHWLTLTGTDLKRREAEPGGKALATGKHYRVTIEEIPE